MKIFKVDNKTANTLMLLIFITLSSLFTGFGLYDKLVNAENTWKLLNDERITHVYEFLINDIENKDDYEE